MGRQIKIEMPRISASADAGDGAEGEGAALASWLVAVGDPVSAGEIIAELETDKSTLELEAPATGSLSEILVEEGTEGVLPGTLLATFAVDASSEPPSDSNSSPAPVEAAPALSESPQTPAASPPLPPPSPQAPSDSSGVRRSTPLARRAAEERGIDLDGLSGSGPGGRVLEADVLGQGSGEGVSPATQGSEGSPGRSVVAAAKPAAASAAPFEVVRHSAMGKTIARRMTESKQTVPHFYLSMKCLMDEVMSVRARLNGELLAAGREVKLSLNDFIIKAAALALRDVPQANVQFTPEAMHVFSTIDISVAVATDGGLVTPVVRQADRKSLSKVAEEVKSLAERARRGALEPSEYQGGTFTISNLGMYGIETVYPILNPPQACILGVGAAEAEAVVRDGQLVPGLRARFTLAADHRAVDGAIGAELLAAFRRRIEDPLSLIL